MQTTPITPMGAEKLNQELKTLKTVDRPRVINAISEARSHGDLKENAEYLAAREQQGLIEARIRYLEGKLSNCQIIDVTELPASDRVVFGATVTVYHVDEDREITYRIVGEDESDLKDSKISITSPIARALIGRSVDDEVAVQTPSGEVQYEIVNVQYI